MVHAKWLNPLSFPFHSPKPKWYPLTERKIHRTRYLRRIKTVQNEETSGEICIKYGLVEANGWRGTRSRQEWQEFWVSLLQSVPNGKLPARRRQRRFGNRLSTSAPEAAKIVLPGSDRPSPQLASSAHSSGQITPSTTEDSSKTSAERKNRLHRRRRRTRSRRGSVVKFQGPDVMGVMFVEVCSAKDLPPERNGKRWMGERITTVRLFADHNDLSCPRSHSNRI